MIIRFPSDQLSAHCKGRLPEFRAAVEQVAKVEQGMLEIDADTWGALTLRFRDVPSNLPEPTLHELAANFTDAVARWSRSGFGVVSRESYEARSAICESCSFWDGAARLGLGKCNAPMCGCTKFKRWLTTEKCPLAKWPL